MNRFEGWTETGANFDPKLNIVREEVRDYIARELAICRKVGLSITDIDEIDTLEQRLWQHHLLEPGAHLEAAYPGLLEEAIN